MGAIESSQDATTEISGQLVDIHAGRVYPATVLIAHGKVSAIEEDSGAGAQVLMPGFVDAHVHIESSMLSPGEFARAAVVHGTIATVSDPHEIANVLGMAGIDFMLRAASEVPLKIRFGAPSCVPATIFETAGAELNAAAVTRLLADERIGYLSEVMNYPGVLSGDEQVMAKIAAAQRVGKPIDGHAPGLRGDDAARYVAAGISTDHECTSQEEALEKMAAGCKIQIREGSAAKNFEALQPLIASHSDRCMFCTDDTHPDDLLEGHINRLVKRAVQGGADLFGVLRMASLNAIEHYGLPVGTLRVGDPADFIVLDDLASMRVRKTFIDGQLVAEDGQPLFEATTDECPNQFSILPKRTTDFGLAALSDRALIIEAVDGELVTRQAVESITSIDGLVQTDADRDLLKLVVVNRYQDAAPAVALIRGFGLKRGAIASSVAHDSHNIVAVGVDDASLCGAINEVIGNRGGLAVAAGSDTYSIALPIAGLMSAESCEQVGRSYAQLSSRAKQLGSDLGAPFMTLSFMALPVIPALKLTDRGLFDVTQFQFVSPFV